MANLSPDNVYFAGGYTEESNPDYLTDIFYKSGSKYTYNLGSFSARGTVGHLGFSGCPFFSEYNAANPSKAILEWNSDTPPGNVGSYDTSLKMRRIWTDSRLIRNGKACYPLHKESYEKAKFLTWDYYTEYASDDPAAYGKGYVCNKPAGILWVVAGGGGGGGGDGGGWLDEPSGGGGGGSGAYAIIYYRYKDWTWDNKGGNYHLKVSWNYNTNTNQIVYGAGGSAEKTGGTGAWCKVWYQYGSDDSDFISWDDSNTLINLGPGTGGAGHNENNTNSGGSGGTATPILTTIDNNQLFATVITYGNGLGGQASGQGGVGGRASDASFSTYVPASNSTTHTMSSSYTGGSGGKANNSDPGGGGGAASIGWYGGAGSNGDSGSGIGAKGSGGGGGAERSTGGARGGCPYVREYYSARYKEIYDWNMTHLT